MGRMPSIDETSIEMSVRPVSSQSFRNGAISNGSTGAVANIPVLPPSAQNEIELVFVEPLLKDFECPVCTQVLRYPVQFEECGHHVCSNCLPEVLKLGNKCPVDGKSIDREKVYVNKQLQRSIQALRVKCSFHERGCNWDGKLKDIPTHVPECNFAPISCTKGCGVIFERRYLEQHLAQDCDKRIIECEHCKKELKNDQRRDHLLACPKFPLDCPNNCGVRGITRDALQQHMDRGCKKAGSACPFAEFGCTHQGEKSSLQKHIREEPTRHLSILCDGTAEIKRMMQTMQLNMERFSKRLDDITLKCDNLEKIYGAQMLWKIEQYNVRFNEAKAGTKTAIFSPPFVTGRHGYKMALSACLYGDGKARGKYFSIFACLCKGEYDALLSWPFASKITITIMDQCQDPAGRRNLSYNIMPNTCKENRPFLSRPTGDRNASFGAAKFCELEVLSQMDYIRDDVMFIKVQVDTEDMVPL